MDIKSILRETAHVRKTNFDINHNSNNINSNNNKLNGNQNKIATLSDYRFDNYESSNKSSNNEGSDKNAISAVKDSIGKKCLILTNEFRKKNKMAPLIWDDNIWKISYGHSKNMGDHIVRFSHDGFNDRITRLPFRYALACENVYMCQGYSEFSIADMAVEGWINSPGHKKNLLSYTTHCAIAAFINSSGEYFLTQIFIRKT